MVKINRIYTRTGDTGETGLVGGARVPKDSARVEAYGEIDELNSLLGWARTLADEGKAEDLAPKLAELQQALFDLGSELATPPGAQWPGMILVSAAQISELENWIDELIADVPELRSFVLPGGTHLNSALHIARAVCRRAERAILRLSRQESVSGNVLTYINRLSDLLFAMARHESKRSGTPEYLWRAGQK
jgi:cob(I)alamin adenosyltransferase